MRPHLASPLSSVCDGDHKMSDSTGALAHKLVRGSEIFPLMSVQGLLRRRPRRPVRSCTSAALPEADVNSPPWLPPLSARTGLVQCSKRLRIRAHRRHSITPEILRTSDHWRSENRWRWSICGSSSRIFPSLSRNMAWCENNMFPDRWPRRD